MSDLPDLQAVESSNLSHVGYTPEKQQMVVRFKNGGTYRYQGVPPHVHKAFMEAESKGKHFAAHISGNYTHEKLPS